MQIRTSPQRRTTTQPATVCWVVPLRLQVGSLLKEVCVGSFEILQGLLQGLRWHIGQKLVLHFPVGQQGTQSSVAQTLFLFLMAFYVKSEGFVECGHVSAENRKSQAKFVCIECGFSANADWVGAVNIREAGLASLACSSASGALSPSWQEPTEGIPA
jgi:hypothetical protein